MSGPSRLMMSRTRAGVASKIPPPGYPSASASVSGSAGVVATANGGNGRSGTARIEMASLGSKEITVASYDLVPLSTLTLSEPATTCAFVITRLGEITKPVPSNTFWQLGATPRIRNTLGAVASTTGLAASPGSGASTAAIGVRLNGSSTAGNPESSSIADNRRGTFLSQFGAMSST